MESPTARTPTVNALPTSTPVVPVRPARRSFAQELDQLACRFAGRSARLSEVLAATQGRGFELFLVLIALPFLTPIPLVGLSTPFGLVVLLIGARLAVGRRPWLPRRLLERELPARFIRGVLKAASLVVRWLEFLLRPRLMFFHDQMLFRRLAGTLIMLSGLFMLLPLPLPFTNSLPALTVVLLAAGAMERDGLFFLAGCAIFTVTLAYFGLLAFGGAQFVDGLRDALRPG